MYLEGESCSCSTSHQPLRQKWTRMIHLCLWLQYQSCDVEEQGRLLFLLLWAFTLQIYSAMILSSWKRNLNEDDIVWAPNCVCPHCCCSLSRVSTMRVCYWRVSPPLSLYTTQMPAVSTRRTSQPFSCTHQTNRNQNKGWTVYCIIKSWMLGILLILP